MLEKGETFYINDLDLKIQILKRIRTATGDYIYETDHTIETIEDLESKVEAENEIAKLEAEEKARRQEMTEQLEKEGKQKESVKQEKAKENEEKSWFERWFG